MNKDEIVLSDVLSAIYRQRYSVIAVALAGTVIALVLAFTMTPIYRANVLLAPNVGESNQSGSLARLAGQLGGLANIAGLSFGGAATNKAEAVATLRSRAFSEQFIEESGLLPALFPEIWDPDSNDWAVDSQDDIPSIAAGYFRLDDARMLSEDRVTGFITLSVESPRRDLAAKLANSLVEHANAHMRQLAIKEAQESIEYLNQELEKTSVVGVRQGIFSLIHQQINKIMLANIDDEYAFKVLDPAYVPGEKSFVRPRRALIVVLGVLLGAMLGMMVALIRDAQARREVS
jgi:uncharacterized protein involved in exopolysaccharide biosynthesis